MLGQYGVDQLRGVGPKTAERLSKIHINTVFDLLFHLPRDYQDRHTHEPISKCKPDSLATVRVTTVSARIAFGKRRQLICEVKDPTGTMVLRFFHFNASQKALFSEPGTELMCYGQVRRHHPRGLCLIHPEYHCADEDEPVAQDGSGYYTPVYSTTAGLQQKMFHQLIPQALALFQTLPDECVNVLPEVLRKKHDLASVRDALLFIHKPPLSVDSELLQERAHSLQQRLALEELIATQWGMMQREKKQVLGSVSLSCAKGSVAEQWQERLLATLPFTMTQAQKRVCDEIRVDCESTTPMMRLVQGDVGSGKTLVAVLSAVQALANGYQVAFMAPTELLVRQHVATITPWLLDLGIKVLTLVGSQKAAQRRAVLEEINSDTPVCVVGTHALFQDSVSFGRLGLVICDEQHRFGVAQRLRLQEKGDSITPHQLVMTATPIPRSLAMIAYAHCSHSVIDELPPGRQPVQTSVCSLSQREKAMERVAALCDEGAQVYWVCPLVRESDKLQVQAAEVTAVHLQESWPKLAVSVLHGQLPTEEKIAVMADFVSGKCQVLVATTVIEVGVDVPNASVMVIDHAERFGLAQLHQLRGRVGRGSKQSYCVLLYQAPLSQEARYRLDVMRRCIDGFAVAEADLAQRGPGEMMGTDQAGHWEFRLLDLVADQGLIPLAQELLASLSLPLTPNQQALLSAWTNGSLAYLSA